MNSDYIKQLILEGEHEKQDFKYAINDSRKIARSISAFCNSKGGKLLIGVKDNGKINGIKSDEEYYMIEAAANYYCKPQANFNAIHWTVDGKSVLEVTIKKSDILPVYVKEEDGKWIAYTRVGDKNIKASSVQMQVWKRQNKKTGTFIQVSEAENKLISYLYYNEPISLSKTIKLLHLTKKEAEKVLVNLICFGVIEMIPGEKGTLYKIVKDHTTKF